MPKLSGNKGEWSEIYVFLRALAVGKLYAADENLNKVDDVFYNIINIVRNENIGVLEFRVDKVTNMITVYNTETKQVLSEQPMDVFMQEANDLYNKIVAANTPSFSVDETECFLSHVGVETLKAKSSDKSDIRIKIHDINTGYESLQGFSIKSRLGSPSTLINAGKTTNFIFEVTGDVSDAVMNEFNTCSKLFRDRFSSLSRNNCDISYCGMENDIFESNLLLLDSSLPEICAEMLKTYFVNGIANVKEALDNIPSYTECFISENLLRKYTDFTKLELSKEAEEEANKWKEKEATNKGRANISYDVRKSDSPTFYLDMTYLSNWIDKAKNKTEDLGLSRSATIYKPMRDAVGHTSLLTDIAKQQLYIEYENIKARLVKLLKDFDKQEQDKK